MLALVTYGGLFAAAFVAATILPFQSEALLVGLLLGEWSPWLLVVVASAGNVLGSVVNWLLGRGIVRYRNRPWFPVDADRIERAQSWYRHYGRWSLLASWAPVIGDPLTVAAGILGERFGVFLALVTLAKTGRYTFLALVTLNFF